MHVVSFEIRQEKVSLNNMPTYFMHTQWSLLDSHNMQVCTHIIFNYLSTRLYFLPNFAHSLEANGIVTPTNQLLYVYGIRRLILELHENKIFRSIRVTYNYYSTSQLFLQYMYKKQSETQIYRLYQKHALLIFVIHRWYYNCPL